MCLYPKKMINRKYTCTKKNEYVMPDFTVGHSVPLPPEIGRDTEGYPIYDERILEVEIPCGHCIECRKQKAAEWRARICEEINVHKYNYFVTLTFNPEELLKLADNMSEEQLNRIATKAVRRHLERYRKDYKKSLKHWYITELGHQGTERIHLHGIIFADHKLTFGEPDENNMRDWSYWRYGKIFVGNYVNMKTANYIVKYMTKIDDDHKGFEGVILCSPGIGKNWLEKHKNDPTYKYMPGRTRSDYRLNNGAKTKLPTYYRNHLFNEEEKEKIWRDFLDTGKISIMGIEHKDLSNKTLGNIMDRAQETNIELGYGSDSDEWKKQDYNITEAMVRRKTRKEIQNAVFSTKITEIFGDIKN